MARKPDFMVTALATTNCSGCVLTPDGQSLVFTTDHEVRRVPVGGGASVLIAGRFGEGGEDGSVATPARFRWPRGVVIGEDGSIFVADDGNHRIRRIMGDNVTTFAGSGEEGGADGVRAAASFTYPSGLALGPGGVLYVTERHRVRMISPAGAVTTLAGNRVQGSADGRGAAARFYYPAGIAVDAAGVVFVADEWNHRIRRITNGVVDTLAGTGVEGFADGAGAAAQFNWPNGLALDPTTGHLLVADMGNHRIRSVDPRSGTVTTLPIGGGAAQRPDIGAPPLDAALLNLSSLSAITVDRAGSLYAGIYGGIVRIDNPKWLEDRRRIREQAREVKNALLGNLFMDRDRDWDEEKAAAVSRHAARVAHPLRSGDDAVSRAIQSGVLAANLGKYFTESAEPVSGQLTNPHTLLRHLRNQHDALVPVGSRLPAPAPPPPPGGRRRKTRKHKSRNRRSRRQRR